MNVLVDTSVWSIAFRRDASHLSNIVLRLNKLIDDGDYIFCTGIILQELLQGFHGPKQKKLILEHFQSLAMIVPTLEDHIQAALLRNRCRRSGISIGTIDVLIASLCITRKLTLFTSDKDFHHVAKSERLDILRL